MSFFGKNEVEKLTEKINKSFENEEQKEVVISLLEIIEDMSKAYEEIALQVGEIDEDLSELEEFVYGEEKVGTTELDSEGALKFELKCPACNELVTISLDGEQSDKIVCPNCQAELDFNSGCGGECGGCHGCGE